MSQTTPQTMVKIYKTHEEYQRDAKKMASKGWRVVNMVQEQRNVGCGRGCALGLLAFLFKPKPVFVVTYQRG